MSGTAQDRGGGSEEASGTSGVSGTRSRILSGSRPPATAVAANLYAWLKHLYTEQSILSDADVDAHRREYERLRSELISIHIIIWGLRPLKWELFEKEQPR
jgi:hypothetical protein